MAADSEKFAADGSQDTQFAHQHWFLMTTKFDFLGLIDVGIGWNDDIPSSRESSKDDGPSFEHAAKVGTLQTLLLCCSRGSFSGEEGLGQGCWVADEISFQLPTEHGFRLHC